MDVMRPRKIVLDTNVWIGWLNAKRDAAHAAGPGFARYLSAVVLMELRVGASTARARRELDALAGAYGASGRTPAPGFALFDAAGRTLQRLKTAGREIRRASLVADVLIAHTARALGASVVTRDRDFEAIREMLDFGLEIVPT